jgi:hypothetical protein
MEGEGPENKGVATVVYEPFEWSRVLGFFLLVGGRW